MALQSTCASKIRADLLRKADVVVPVRAICLHLSLNVILFLTLVSAASMVVF